jgi:hypothetical protein
MVSATIDASGKTAKRPRVLGQGDHFADDTQSGMSGHAMGVGVVARGKASPPRVDGSGIAAGAGTDVSPPTEALARTILKNALERYRRADGYEGHLVEAAWQLELMGREAWPALSELASARVPECEFFLDAMIRTGGVPPQDRRRAFLAAAKNPDANTRSRLLELLDDLAGDLRNDVLLALASPDLPEDDVTDRARGMLESRQP